MLHVEASGVRQGAGRLLPALPILALAAAAAAWVWPVGERSSVAVAPSGITEVPALGTPAEARRSALPAPAPDEEAPRLGASDSALAAGPDERARSGEREHFERFLVLAAQDPLALEAQAAPVLDGQGPDCEKVALLRALEAGASPRLNAWLEHAILALPDTGDAAAVSVPDFALGRLAHAAATDASARGSLERIAFGTPRAPDRLRRVAGAALAERATQDELWRLSARLAREDDELLRSSVLEALTRNGSPSAVAAVFGTMHGGPRPESAGADQE